MGRSWEDAQTDCFSAGRRHGNARAGLGAGASGSWWSVRSCHFEGDTRAFVTGGGFY